MLRGLKNVAKNSKKQKGLRAALTPGVQHAILSAVEVVKKCATAKFDEGFDVAMVLGVDGTKSDQAVRGATILPIGQILGPKGLMPNPKVGTVSSDAGTAVKNAKSGQVRYRSDKNGIVHCSIGKVSFTPDAIKQNIESLLQDLKKLKPSTAKGTYLKKLIVSSTMGPAVHVDLSSLSI
ncbi:MAG: 50S ribosomal protein L1 [Gammaproteobacteria bacterium]|nr:50S ribosomal protein L1 [Gammaproteobacteria bacterium]